MASLERLAGLDRLPDEGDLVSLLPLDPADLASVATGQIPSTPWGRVAAVRLLGRTGGPGAAEALAEVLIHVDDLEDRLAEEALLAVEGLGPEALPPLVLSLRGSPQGRELAVEAALRLVTEFEAPQECLEALRTHLESRFRHARHPSDRILYAGYLGDLGEPSAVPTLLSLLASPALVLREYEAVREAVERLGDECPDVYFDAEGHPYPVDDEGVLRCGVCGESLRMDTDSGCAFHDDGTPARH